MILAVAVLHLVLHLNHSEKLLGKHLLVRLFGQPIVSNQPVAACSACKTMWNETKVVKQTSQIHNILPIVYDLLIGTMTQYSQSV